MIGRQHSIIVKIADYLQASMFKVSLSAERNTVVQCITPLYGGAMNKLIPSLLISHLLTFNLLTK